MEIAVLGIDLGKTVCSLSGLDRSGAVVLRKRIQRYRCQSARKLDPLSACKNSPLGALGQLARCGVALIQRSRIGPAGFWSFAGLEAPAFVAGLEDVTVVGKSIE